LLSSTVATDGRPVAAASTGTTKACRVLHPAAVAARTAMAADRGRIAACPAYEVPAAAAGRLDELLCQDKFLHRAAVATLGL
jgi:hypothetical protein